MSESWHSMEVDKALETLGSRKEGLNSQQVQEKLNKYGFNELKEIKKRTALQMFLGQFKDIFIFRWLPDCSHLLVRTKGLYLGIFNLNKIFIIQYIFTR